MTSRVETQRPRFAGLLQPARWLVAALAAIAVAALLAAIWVYPDYAAANPDSFTPTEAWTPELIAAAIAQLGWSPLALAYRDLALGVLGLLVYMTLGLVILFRGPRSWFGIFTALTFVSLTISNAIFDSVAAVVPAFAVLESAISQVAWQLSFILLYVFPDGRFVPGWSRWLLLPWIALNIVYLPGLAPELVTSNWWLPIPLVLSAMGSQIYRYFRRADPVQRAQTKWVVYVIALQVPLVFTYGFLVPLSAGELQLTDNLGSILRSTLFWGTVSWASGVLIPVAFAIAILRYRLFDIDVIIRKTLLYAALSALLGLLFYGSVVLLQGVLNGITGRTQTSQLTIVLSTLLIAALFTPLRRRVQETIDRRFYRRKYNATQTLAQFAQTTRDEVELERLTAELVRVLEETMRPETVSVWLKPAGSSASK